MTNREILKALVDAGSKATQGEWMRKDGHIQSTAKPTALDSIENDDFFIQAANARPTLTAISKALESVDKEALRGYVERHERMIAHKQFLGHSIRDDNTGYKAAKALLEILEG